MLYERCDKEQRAIIEAAYILENKTTVRDCGKHFGVSKSTVHKDVTQRLFHINKTLWGSVRAVLDVNKEERHMRGGIATRNKYLALKQNEKTAVGQ